MGVLIFENIITLLACGLIFEICWVSIIVFIIFRFGISTFMVDMPLKTK